MAKRWNFIRIGLRSKGRGEANTIITLRQFDVEETYREGEIMRVFVGGMDRNLDWRLLAGGL